LVEIKVAQSTNLAGDIHVTRHRGRSLIERYEHLRRTLDDLDQQIKACDEELEALEKVLPNGYSFSGDSVPRQTSRGPRKPPGERRRRSVGN